MHKIVPLFISMAMFISTACAHEGHDHEASPVIEGQHYTRLVQEAPVDVDGKIEVRELFWYGCPHCYKLEPTIQNYKTKKGDDVNFVAQPAIFSKRWEIDAKAFYAFKVLKILGEAHTQYFEAKHRDKKAFNTPEEIGQWVEDIGLAKKADFIGAYNSFAVDGSVRRAKQLTTRYGIEGVPAVVVNGKYLTSVSKAGSETKLIEVIQHLVDLERTK